MLKLRFKFIVGNLADVYRRVQEMLVALGAQRRCACRLDALGDRLLGMGANITRLRTDLHAGKFGESIDLNGSMRGSLKALKRDIGEIRCELAAIEPPGASARLLRAFKRLGKIAQDTYALADKLQWEIDEHERAVRRP